MFTHLFVFSDETSMQHMSVYLGKSAINETDDGQQRFTVEKLIIHQNYNETNFNNDIGTRNCMVCMYVRKRKSSMGALCAGLIAVFALHFSTVEDQKQKWRMCCEVSVCTDSVSSSTSHPASCRISVQHCRIWKGALPYVLKKL